MVGDRDGAVRMDADRLFGIRMLILLWLLLHLSPFILLLVVLLVLLLLYMQR